MGWWSVLSRWIALGYVRTKGSCSIFLGFPILDHLSRFVESLFWSCTIALYFWCWAYFFHHWLMEFSIEDKDGPSFEPWAFGCFFVGCSEFWWCFTAVFLVFLKVIKIHHFIGKVMIESILINISLTSIQHPSTSLKNIHSTSIHIHQHPSIHWEKLMINHGATTSGALLSPPSGGSRGRHLRLRRACLRFNSSSAAAPLGPIFEWNAIGDFWQISTNKMECIGIF